MAIGVLVHGLDLLAYRWKGGGIRDLIAKVVTASARPVVIAAASPTSAIDAVCAAAAAHERDS
jgi:hypothetical protein